METSLHPQVKWCQRKDKICAKQEARNPKKETLQFVEPNMLKYSGESTDGKTYKMEQELFEDFDIENSGYKRIGYNMEVVIKKKEQNTWPRFTKDTKKLAYVGVDWNNWVDSDDEDPEEEDQQQDFNFGPQEGDSDEEDDVPEDLDDLEAPEDVEQTQKLTTDAPDTTEATA